MDKTTMQIRGLVSLGMLIFILIMILTGIILWLAILGVMNNPGLWNFASQVHPIAGVTMFILGIIHLMTNKKMLFNDLKTLKSKK